MNMKKHAFLMGLMASAIMYPDDLPREHVVEHSDYGKLIEEYKLIQQKKSKLSSTQRVNVINQIKSLIRSGEIKEEEL